MLRHQVFNNTLPLAYLVHISTQVTVKAPLKKACEDTSSRTTVN